MNISDILNVLPHRYPFVLVDRVDRIVPGEIICARKCVTYNELWFQGHFPDTPIMPGVLIVEALAQICGILAHASCCHGSYRQPAKRMAIASIDKVRFRKFVSPGDVLQLTATVLHQRENAWKFHAQATVQNGTDNEMRTQCELMLVSVSSDPALE